MNALPSFLHLTTSPLELLLLAPRTRSTIGSAILRRMTTGTTGGAKPTGGGPGVIRQQAGMGPPSPSNFSRPPPETSSSAPRVSRLEAMGVNASSRRPTSMGDPSSIPVSAVGGESELARHMSAIDSAPTVPKLIGFLGAVPFLALSPIFLQAIDLPHFSDSCAEMQLAYGATICAFLGAVHWGAAMQSSLAGPAAMKAATERYVWSVVPVLLAAPALVQRPLVTSASLTMALFLCFLQDRSYARSGLIPPWYMALRGPLTALACLGTASSFLYFLDKEMEKNRRSLDEEVQTLRERSHNGQHPSQSVVSSVEPAAAAAAAAVSSPPSSAPAPAVDGTSDASDASPAPAPKKKRFFFF